jgi:hypothetical protein
MSDRPAFQNAAFATLFAQVTAAGASFGHREHVHLTWLAIRAVGPDAACPLVGDGLRTVARYAQMPQKYHVTVSRAWVLLIAHHLRADPTDDFTEFLERSPELLDKRLLRRFYRSTTLAGSLARTSWVEPDLAPLPQDDVASSASP